MMLRHVIVKTVTLIAALERQNLTRTYLPHHELALLLLLSLLTQHGMQSSQPSKRVRHLRGSELLKSFVVLLLR